MIKRMRRKEGNFGDDEQRHRPTKVKEFNMLLVLKLKSGIEHE